MTDPQTPIPAWQLLDRDMHIHTLKNDYCPVGLLQMVEPGVKSVLDVGCFCGGSGRWLKLNHPGVEVIGIEPLKPAAAQARVDYDQVYENVFEDLDVQQLEWQGKFDAIIAADVLEHMFNPWKTLQLLRAVLSPKGKIYISIPNIRNANILCDLANGAWNYQGAGILDVTHIRFFTRMTLVKMLEETGWVAESVIINPDPALVQFIQGNMPDTVKTIRLDKLILQGLNRDDVVELATLQFFVKARLAI